MKVWFLYLLFFLMACSEQYDKIDNANADKYSSKMRRYFITVRLMTSTAALPESNLKLVAHEVPDRVGLYPNIEIGKFMYTDADLVITITKGDELHIFLSTTPGEPTREGNIYNIPPDRAHKFTPISEYERDVYEFNIFNEENDLIARVDSRGNGFYIRLPYKLKRDEQ